MCREDDVEKFAMFVPQKLLVGVEKLSDLG